MSLKIVSWNILQGGGSRINGICKALLSLKPDILVLQEARNGKHLPHLIDTMDELGLAHRVLPESSSSKNTALLASRIAFEIQPWPDLADHPYANEIDEERMFLVTFGADQNTSASGESYSHLPFTMITAHLPHKKAQRPYFEALLHNTSLLQSNSMIIGDLNSGIPFVDSETKTFANTHMFQELLRRGWIDSWRSRHQSTREYTWISPRGKGYRYDHCLCSKELDVHVNRITYKHNLREEKLSDHSALVVIID